MQAGVATLASPAPPAVPILRAGAEQDLALKAAVEAAAALSPPKQALDVDSAPSDAGK